MNFCIVNKKIPLFANHFWITQDEMLYKWQPYFDHLHEFIKLFLSDHRLFEMFYFTLEYLYFLPMVLNLFL